MLFTEQQLSRRRGIAFPQPERIKKVRKSMGAIKQVLGERKRDHLSKVALKKLNQTENDNVGDDVEEDEEEEKKKKDEIEEKGSDQLPEPSEPKSIRA